MFYTGYPLVNHIVTLNYQLVYTLAYAHGRYTGSLDSDREVAQGAPCLHEHAYEPSVLKQHKRSCIYIYIYIYIVFLQFKSFGKRRRSINAKQIEFFLKKSLKK